MNKIFISALLVVACLLGGCGTDITCKTDDVMKNMVSMSSSECKSMYDGKVIRVTGPIVPISDLRKGHFILGMRFTKTGSKALVAKVKDTSSLSGYSIGDDIVLEGKAKYIDENENQGIMIEDAKIIK